MAKRTPEQLEHDNLIQAFKEVFDLDYDEGKTIKQNLRDAKDYWRSCQNCVCSDCTELRHDYDEYMQDD